VATSHHNLSATPACRTSLPCKAQRLHHLSAEPMHVFRRQPTAAARHGPGGTSQAAGLMGLPYAAQHPQTGPRMPQNELHISVTHSHGIDFKDAGMLTGTRHAEAVQNEAPSGTVYKGGHQQGCAGRHKGSMCLWCCFHSVHIVLLAVDTWCTAL